MGAFDLITNAPPGGLSDRESGVFSNVTICERGEMAGALAGGGYDLAVCDTIQIPGLAAYPGRAVLVLRETPEARLAGFHRDDGRPWDRVIVPNPADHWLPGAGAEFARSVEPAGWITRAAGLRQPGQSTGIVVATGGGGTPATRALLYPMLEAAIGGARRLLREPFVVRQALGPRAENAALSETNEVFDPGGDLNAIFRDADLVISTAGYNSVLELAGTDTPAFLAAVPRSLDDQVARVRLWGGRLGFGMEPDRVEEASRWLADQIDRPRRRAPVDLGPDGAERAANLIMDMLCPVS
ncbi:hypothetical protein [Ovoidimarina sediminis]|uniref:hypothetical protein n=1 Tax=Ovoidimarina sediminis TaxID=3079856 RepID=UPI00290C2DD4|nr:hypothetical protein [Rhodophyticola sp. MJ-SS7]MDU8943173.1 hypothetical protein [Rhodophyticola sp. MJ-SS7]